MKFNVNGWVKVRLNDYGVQILRNNHIELMRRLPVRLAFKEPARDEEGYSSFQMWAFMQEFGSHMILGCEIPFDSEIIIVEGK